MCRRFQIIDCSVWDFTFLLVIMTFVITRRLGLLLFTRFVFILIVFIMISSLLFILIIVMVMIRWGRMVTIRLIMMMIVLWSRFIRMSSRSSLFQVMLSWRFISTFLSRGRIGIIAVWSLLAIRRLLLIRFMLVILLSVSAWRIFLSFLIGWSLWISGISWISLFRGFSWCSVWRRILFLLFFVGLLIFLFVTFIDGFLLRRNDFFVDWLWSALFLAFRLSCFNNLFLFLFFFNLLFGFTLLGCIAWDWVTFLFYF